MNVLQIVLGCSGKTLKLMDQKPIYAVQAAGVRRGKIPQEEYYYMKVQKEQLEKLRNETWKRGNKEQITEKIDKLQKKIDNHESETEKKEKHEDSKKSKDKKKKRKDRNRRKNKKCGNRSRRSKNDNDLQE